MKFKPTDILIVFSVALAMGGVLSSSKTFYLHYSDKFFVFNTSQFYFCFAIILLIEGILYRLAFKFPFSRIATWAHISGSLLAVTALTIVINLTGQSIGSGDFGYGVNFHKNNKTMIWLFFIFVLVQFFLLVYIAVAELRRRRTAHN